MSQWDDVKTCLDDFLHIVFENNRDKFNKYGIAFQKTPAGLYGMILLKDICPEHRYTCPYEISKQVRNIVQFAGNPLSSSSSHVLVYYNSFSKKHEFVLYPFCNVVIDSNNQCVFNISKNEYVKVFKVNGLELRVAKIDNQITLIHSLVEDCLYESEPDSTLCLVSTTIQYETNEIIIAYSQLETFKIVCSIFDRNTLQKVWTVTSTVDSEYLLIDNHLSIAHL